MVAVEPVPTMLSPRLGGWRDQWKGPVPPLTEIGVAGKGRSTTPFGSVAEMLPSALLTVRDTLFDNDTGPAPLFCTMTIAEFGAKALTGSVAVIWLALTTWNAACGKGRPFTNTIDPGEQFDARLKFAPLMFNSAGSPEVAAFGVKVTISGGGRTVNPTGGTGGMLSESGKGVKLITAGPAAIRSAAGI